MKALISPTEKAFYASSWELTSKGYRAVLTECGVRVAEVCEESFEVAEPLFWLDCSSDVVADLYCYADDVIKKKPADAPFPENNIPVTVA